MARSIESFDMFSVRAAITAARRRGFMAGSGRPSLAATVISRASLLNSLDFTASCRPLRCMMFLNCECPAIASSLDRLVGVSQPLVTMIVMPALVAGAYVFKALQVQRRGWPGQGPP